MAFLAELLKLAFLASVLAHSAQAQLSATFYATTCPTLQATVLAQMTQAVATERRMGASILRLFFHDCFVSGCDASVLLDGNEKTAFQNQDSLRGFDVIDAVKAAVETTCLGVVSCADILALSARAGTVLLGGPTWPVLLGRRDSLTASKALAESSLPLSSFTLAQLVANFGAKNMTPTDLTALSGAHSIGLAQCGTFKDHIYNDTNIDPAFATLRRATCARAGTDTATAPLDATTQNLFDNAYYTNMIARRGLLKSDQELFNGGSQDALVRTYGLNSAQFFADFAAAMVKLGNLDPLTGTNGQIRANCHRVN